MAIFHYDQKPIKRSERSAVASAAYRSGSSLKDERQGLRFSYQRRESVDHTEIQGWGGSREVLWNEAESAERRRDARTAREHMVALPNELNPEQQQELASAFGYLLQKHYGCGVDIAIHDQDSENPHAHIMTTTRQINADGTFGDKTDIELSNKKAKELGKSTSQEQIKWLRTAWERLANVALKNASVDEQIDSRSLKDKGEKRTPQIPLSPAVWAMEQRGEVTEMGNRWRAIEAENTKGTEQNEKIINGMPDPQNNPFQQMDLQNRPGGTDQEQGSGPSIEPD